MLSEDKYSTHPSVKFETIILEKIILKEHKPLPLWHTSMYWLKLHRWQQPFFSCSQLQLTLKRLSQGSQHYVLRRHLSPLSKLQPNSSIAAEGEVAGKQCVCPWQKLIWLPLEQLQLQRESCRVQEDDKEPAGKASTGTASQEHVLKEMHLALFQNCCSIQGPPILQINASIFLSSIVKTCSHQQLNRITEQTNSYTDYHQYIILHTTRTTVFLIHLQTQAFLGVLWQYFHQATVTVRLDL